ncbi:hypothetical protein R1sor_016835 [Riccia sorocarpa]|uniref:EndoU domain-containing protein n=1 Tax=Riccia sorocarpa TaxID=122646 RepID=A0ABD3HI06_9MARC
MEGGRPWERKVTDVIIVGMTTRGENDKTPGVTIQDDMEMRRKDTKLRLGGTMRQTLRQVGVLIAKLTPRNTRQEEKESKFSMRGMFSALKKTVKAKMHGVLNELTNELRQQFKLPASEQQYAEPVSSDVKTDPTEEELQNVIAACGRLWNLDINRLTPGRDYEIDCGEGKKMYQREDMVENALFRHLDPSVLRRPTYARFIALLDNYSADTGETERRTRQEEQEEIAFIEEISRTAPIQYVQKYLSARGVFRGGDEQFKHTLRNLWFRMMDRGGTDDSTSAFEHVFVGEIKRGRDNTEEVSGLHNWLQFYLEEAKGALDYQGFILPRRRGTDLPDSQTQLLTVQFKWNDRLKPLSSTLIGVSPEFEFALYTLCFYCGREDNHIQLGPYYVNIKVYRLGRDGMGSAFPIADE